MNPAYRLRATQVQDIAATFEVRAQTPDNAISPERLALLGITPESQREALERGEQLSWVVERDAVVHGFCCVNPGSGEVLVLAVRAGHQGQGLGRALLQAALDGLHAAGSPPAWLWGAADPSLRAPGFYRSQGWRPTGRRNAQGDEELRAPPR